LSDGSQLEADVVVVGIGVTPCVDWLRGSGLQVDDGVVCDASCATNVPGVVAAGDVARFHNALFDESMRVEHWSNAVDQAQAVASTLLGNADAAAPFAPVPYFWSDQYDVKLQFAGRIRHDDELRVVEGSLADKSFTVLYGRAGRLRGVLASNRPQQLIRVRKLLAERASFEAAIAAITAPKPA
jgi:NADPH-dependent 2,4-dienoyl-CoA reductase/sulfur reductase-like enzyme